MCTEKWICYTYAYTIHISTLFKIIFPYRALQSIEQEFPVVHSRSLLVIYFIYNNVLSFFILIILTSVIDISLCL